MLIHIFCFGIKSFFVFIFKLSLFATNISTLFTLTSKLYLLFKNTTTFPSVLGIAAAAFCFAYTKTIAESPALALHPNKIIRIHIFDNGYKLYTLILKHYK